MPFTAGLPETACGAGSTVAFTEHLRPWLADLLRELKVRTLLDAPCGDFNWMARVDLSGIDYAGCDYDAQHIRAALARESEPPEYRPRSKSMMVLDLCEDKLPFHADLMLCRDFMQHLPDRQIVRVLRRFLNSGIPWLLATSHVDAENCDIIRSGMFRPLNLMRSPWDLPEPRRCKQDGDSRILGLWHRDEVAV